MASGLLNLRSADLLRELAPQVLGVVIRRFHDFAAAEDAVQEALLAATVQWPKDGVPDNPRAWLIQVATRRLTDHVRADSARRRRETNVAREAGLASSHAAPPLNEDTEQDDTLILLFMCCHPSLTPSSSIALTLRAVGGLTTAEIARAFLVPEVTMAQRISRAKNSIKTSGARFDLPSPRERAERLGSVLHVLYLIFNEGYTSTSGPQLQRPELAREAIRLVRCVRALLPDDTEVAGLLALMLLTDARRTARTGPDGDLIPLDLQNRALWDRSQIAEGTTLLAAVLPKGVIGPYQLQAAIAAVHDEAERHEDTDWPQILALYEVLGRLSDNPVVKLNQAVAAAMVHGASAGLEMLSALDADGRLAGNHRLDTVRAYLLEKTGDLRGAITHYRSAATRTTSLPERNHLITQAARLAEDLMAGLTTAVTTEKAHREKLSRELDIARDVQQRLFPQELPSVPGLDLFGACRPASSVGGDYYDFLALPGDHLGIAIGDVAGKGIAAALTMANLHALLRSEALRANSDPAEIVGRVNMLLHDATASNRYATFFYGDYAPATRTLTYLNAGHNPPLLFKKNHAAAEVVRLDTGGTVIGLFKDSAYQHGSISLEEGDLLVIVTDGITEAMNSADEEWGEDNLIRTVQSSRPLPARDIASCILRAADTFAGGAEQHDDMTIVILSVR